MTEDMNWIVPDPLASCEVRLDDETVTVLRRHGNPQGPRLVLSHGNGLAIDLYYPFWSHLTEDYDLILYDQRNHGWNSVGDQQKHDVPTLIHDQRLILEAIDDQFGHKPKVGVYHSVSALITLLSISTFKDLISSGPAIDFAGLVLFDPPLCKPGVSQVEFDAAAEQVAAATRRRGHLFQTEEDFVELLSYSPGFVHVVPGVRELMAKTTLRRTESGVGFELRCPREYEAQIIDYSRSYSVLVDFDELVCPTKVIGADPTLPYSYLPTLDLRDMVTVDYDFLPETTHFFPLEQPEECVSLLREFLESNSLTHSA